ncbi:CTL-like protein 2 [Ctenocephalides felis]|uniref:CTL-like protein 2 n=1 Tax=Ctenocephalides felis TaxID=7515 RepID=UPI000E6E312F|nr:CTL-like protein 2 [Ctenocephalides felis]
MGKVDYDEKPIQYDPDFHGPVKSRSCTDICCLIVFLAFVVAWIGIGIYAVQNGDIDKILNPADSLQRKCGVHPDVKDKPYLLYFDLLKCAQNGPLHSPCFTPRVCVEKCPDEDFSFNDEYIKKTDFVTLREKIICKPEVNMTRDLFDYKSARELIENRDCLGSYFRSKPIPSSNICVPRNMKKISMKYGLEPDALRNAFMSAKNLTRDGDVSSKVVEDLSAIWWHIVLLLLGSMVVCLIYIVAMRWLAEFFVWFSIALITVLLLAGLGVSFYFFANPNGDDVLKYFALAGGVLFGIMLLFLFIIICCGRRNIKISIALIKLSGRAIGSLPSTLIFPLYPWLLQCLVLACAVVIAMYLASMDNNGSSALNPFPFNQELRIYDYTNSKGDGVVESWNCSKYLSSFGTEQMVSLPCDKDFVAQNCMRTTYESKGSIISYNEYNTNLRPFDAYEDCKMTKRDFGNNEEDPDFLPLIFHAYNGIAFVWLAIFISMMGDMVLAMSFATWYWTFNKSDVPFFTVFQSIVKTYTYHTGTLAFGSLLITICKIIRSFLKKNQNQGNPCVACLICCCRCLCWCIERIIKFITKYATIMCAIHGKNFCVSAKNSMSLILRNVGLFSIGNFVTSSLLLMSQLLVTAVMGIIAYAVFGNDWIPLEEDNTINYWYMPVAIVVVGTLIVTTIFFGVYHMAIDTIALCFLEDCERNDGSSQRPYYMSTELLRIMEKTNKQQ